MARCPALLPSFKPEAARRALSCICHKASALQSCRSAARQPCMLMGALPCTLQGTALRGLDCQTQSPMCCRAGEETASSASPTAGQRAAAEDHKEGAAWGEYSAFLVVTLYMPCCSLFNGPV